MGINLQLLTLVIVILAFSALGCGGTVDRESQEDASLSSSEELSGSQESKSSQVDDTKQVNLPLTNAEKRITKKPFGIYITPSNSPISPERFSGYHTGIDYEIFENETNTNVSVYAICGGKILQKKNVSGYGGVVVQEGELEGQSVIVIYGHLKLSSVKKQAGDSLSAGDQLTFLGKAFSSETGGERKHLHLAIHKGAKIDLRGYVQSKSQLEDWIDFAKYY